MGKLDGSLLPREEMASFASTMEKHWPANTPSSWVGTPTTSGMTDRPEIFGRATETVESASRIRRVKESVRSNSGHIPNHSNLRGVGIVLMQMARHNLASLSVIARITRSLQNGDWDGRSQIIQWLWTTPTKGFLWDVDCPRGSLF